MHQTYWFLFTPTPGEDLLQEAGYYFTQHYAIDLCDENNWSAPQGVITGDGRQVIVPGEEPIFSGLFGEKIPTAEELLACAMREAAELFRLEPQPGEDLQARILKEVPQRLSGLYANAQGGDYCRAQLSEAFELFCDSRAFPFAINHATPYSYRFYDLRDDRWNDGCEIIRPQDAVLFMDIHT